MNVIAGYSVRAVAANEKMIVEGYAIKFESPSQDMGGFFELIGKDALNGVDLSELRCLYNHDTGRVLGRVSASTLHVELDETGLFFRCEFPETSDAKDVYKSIERGDVNNCSFGFEFNENNVEWFKKDGATYSRIKKIDRIFEISIVALPAYENTNVSVVARSFDQYKLRGRALKIRFDLLKAKNRNLKSEFKK